MVKSRPTIIISAAMSVDGKIATKNGDSRISSKKDLVRMHKLRAQVDAIIIGGNTLRRDDPLLTVRHTRGRNPTRVILDSQGAISPDSQILRTADSIPTIIAVSKSAPKKNLQRLEKFQVDVIVSGNRQVDLRQLLRKLASRQIKTVLVEGGGTVNWDLVKNGLFDKLIITISPRIIGGADAVSIVEGSGFANVKSSTKLRLEKTRRIEGELVLIYCKDAT